MIKVWRQGDVLLTPIKQITLQYQKKDNVLAEGEATGHAHRISDAKLWVAKAIAEARGFARMQAVVDAPATVSHEEHESFVLPIDIYKRTIQREFDWAKKLSRKVTD